MVWDKENADVREYPDPVQERGCSGGGGVVVCLCIFKVREFRGTRLDHKPATPMLMHRAAGPSGTKPSSGILGRKLDHESEVVRLYAYCNALLLAGGDGPDEQPR